MTEDPASRLAAVLQAENRALEQFDAAGAAALLEEKLAAARLLHSAKVAPGPARHLRELAAENKRLLERAMLVQGRIVDMVVRAARRGQAVARYGAGGAPVPDRGAIALARQA